MSYAVHPIAALIPEMTPDQFSDLCEDIKAHGLLEPIVLHEHMVLDGRHRLRACELVDVSPRFTDFEGVSPLEFVVSKNLKRRHLTTSQLGAVAVGLLPALEEEARTRKVTLGRAAALRQHHGGSDSKESDPEPNRATKIAGDLVGVSRATVTRAKRIYTEDPEAFEKVKAGEISVYTAEVAIAEQKAGDRNAPATLRTDRDEQRARAHKRKVVDLVSTLSGFARGLDGIDVDRARAVMDEAELREWDRSLGDSLSKLRGFRSNLQKGRP